MSPFFRKRVINQYQQKRDNQRFPNSCNPTRHYAKLTGPPAPQTPPRKDACCPDSTLLAAFSNANEQFSPLLEKGKQKNLATDFKHFPRVSTAAYQLARFSCFAGGFYAH